MKSFEGMRYLPNDSVRFEKDLPLRTSTGSLNIQYIDKMTYTALIKKTETLSPF